MASKADPRRILVDNYFDSVRAEFVQGDHVITINNGLILDILEASGLPDSERSPEGPDVIDLRGLTVLPGFVDTHVHLFLHPYVETPWIDQVTRESMPERTIRAVKHARDTLLSGFTTVRDLGTEGACEADIALRKCISSPVSLIPGPRYFCVTRGIVTTGSYEPKGELYPSQQGVDGVTGAQAADGPDQCMKTVRQQVGAGADWIKVYGDYSARARVSQTSPAVGPRSILLWTKPEWESLVNTSHSLGVKVAVHAETTEAALAALGAGADSIEHGSGFNHTVFEKLREARTIWNPTLAVYYSMDPNGSEWAQCKQNFQNVLRENEQVSYEQSLSVRIATGGDTGVFPHGNNALELQLMHSLGMPARRVLQAATLVGWECVRGMEWDGESGRVRLEAHQRQPETLGDNETPFGCLERGFAADIIATAGDLIGGDEEGFRDAVSAEKVVFVMKSGRVYKLGGKSLV